MPDFRLAKARATLPAGYQFGEARWALGSACSYVGHIIMDGWCFCCSKPYSTPSDPLAGGFSEIDAMFPLREFVGEPEAAD